MNRRLQVRCLLTSAGIHGALILLLLFGAGFQRSHVDALGLGVPLELIAGELIDSLPPERGAPPAQPSTSSPDPRERPPAQPAQPPPRREPRVERREPPAPPPQKPAHPTETPLVEPEAPSVRPKPSPPEKPTFDFDAVRNLRPKPSQPRNNRPPRTADSSRSSDRAAFQALDRQFAAATGSLAENIDRSTIAIHPASGSGRGGGGGSANAGSIRRTYDAAWITPQNVSDKEATTEVEVVIRGDGTVTRARIIRSSGIPALDRSVDDALRAVRRITPFESVPGADTVTFTIGFNLQGR